MPKLIMMIGLSGSGKSTYAAKIAVEEHAIVLSSDDIRLELFGDANVQSGNGQVFDLLHKRARAALMEGVNVVYDATNLSSRRRREFLASLSDIADLRTTCFVVLCRHEECIARQQNRELKVPEDVIMRQLRYFEYPMPDEGWTDGIHCINNSRAVTDMEAEYTKLRGLSQTGRYHLENADNHSRMVEERACAMQLSREFERAARYHDVGKAYTRVVDDAGNVHFPGHENVSAYLFALTLGSGTFSEKELHCLRLIQFHDLIYKNAARFAELPDRLRRELELFHECDMYGAIVPDELATASLRQLIMAFDDWQERLSRSPYHIGIKRSGNYYLFKYSQLESDFSMRAVRDARGCIMKFTDGIPNYVCRPFDKFFNLGETEHAELDWSTARVTEKIDGSLMKVWYDEGKWNLSTNGTIDAFQAAVSDTGITFGEVFERALGYGVNELGALLDPEYTYMFELTSPETRVVISYPDGVYYLSRRNTLTGEENFRRPELPGVNYPQICLLTTEEDVVNAALMLTKDEEGFVVNDCFGRRIKVKSPEYLIAARLTANHNLSDKSLLKLILEDKADDLLAYSPEYSARIRKLSAGLRGFYAALEAAWQSVCEFNGLNDKQFAETVALRPHKEYLFAHRKHPELTPPEFARRMSDDKLIDAVRHYTEAEFEFASESASDSSQ